MNYEELLQAARDRAMRVIKRRHSTGLIPIIQPEYDALVLKFYMEAIQPLQLDELDRVIAASR